LETFYQILAILAAGLIVWFMYRSIKSRPDVFSGENFSKSFTTMGILGLFLIGFIALLIFLVRST